MNHIGTKIKELRKKKDMTQERLAEYLNVSFQAVSKWETGAASPDLSMIVPLARLLGVSTDELFGLVTTEEDPRMKELEAAWDKTYETGDTAKRYEIAKTAVAEYPGNFDYLEWLALAEESYAVHKLQMEKEQLRDNRRKDYYRDVFFNNDIQFEIKLNHIGAYFIGKYKETWQKLYKINKTEDVKHNIINTLIMIINVSSEFLVLTVSVFDVVNSYIGIGDLQYNLSMVSRLRSQSQMLMNKVNQFLNDNTRLIELQEFMDIEPEVEKSGTLKPSDNPKIKFCNVSFRYPNAEQYVLKDCSFTIEPHEKIGLIGLNGAGKSTIIKLMFRFYDPEEGCIKLDGVDLKEYDIYAVRKVFGVLFQDFVTYCLPLREIIALSDFDERFNDEKLKKACDISGASEVIKDWENGYDSVLGRYYADNGKDLSGGQWQLVGLARAYFKDSEYMILDEPSAALDPISEDRIFEQLYHLSEGESSVTISHRLSNTTLADKILVIGDGHIIEQGSHFELLKQNGKYAELFNLQASKYI